MEEVIPNEVYLAPDEQHILVQREDDRNPSDQRILIGLNSDPLENSVLPAADVLFRSVTEVYERKILATILTGMGNDGKNYI